MSVSFATAVQPPLPSCAPHKQALFLLLCTDYVLLCHAAVQPPLPSTQAINPPDKPSPLKSAEVTLAMFKKGGRLKGRSGKGQHQGGNGGADYAPERKVVNCLSCGKIYDCRNVSNDILRFLGKCAVAVSGAWG